MTRDSRLNPPNVLTLLRILAIPVVVLILLPPAGREISFGRSVAAFILFVAATITDLFDGYIARRYHMVTTLGKLLDPLADKLLIAAAFITLVQFNPRIVPAWMAVVIIGREFLVSGLRSIAASQGFTIEASDLGKFKMVVQIVSVVAAILDHRWHTWDFRLFIFPVDVIARVSIWFMVVLSLVSAIDYFAAFWSKIDRQVAKKRRRRAFILSRRRKHDVPAT